MKDKENIMPDYDEVVRALEMCTTPEPDCLNCPYFASERKCSLGLVQDALALLKEYGKNGRKEI